MNEIKILLCNDICEFMNYMQKSNINDNIKMSIINNLHFENDCKYMFVKSFDKSNNCNETYINIFRCKNNVLLTYIFNDENKLICNNSCVCKSFDDYIENCNKIFDVKFMNYDDIKCFL